MRSCATLEQATDARLRDLRESNIDIESAEELRASLKDRRRVEDAEKEIDLVARNVENYVRAIEAELRERRQVLELLEQADQFYETQRGEVKIVTNSCEKFKEKLDELLPTFVSPIPSPDVNAPSPSPDSDIELPGDEAQVTNNQSGLIDVAPPSLYGSYPHEYDALPVPAPEMVQGNETTDFTNNFPSFMGGNVDFSNMRNLFNERSATPPGMSQQYNESLETAVHGNVRCSGFRCVFREEQHEPYVARRVRRQNKGSWMDGDGDRWDSNNDATWSSGRKNEILSETPESPPSTRSWLRRPVEYNEPQPQESLNATGDVDHRVIPIPMTIENQLSTYRLIKAAADVDHRNLISLTGSPANHNSLGDLSLSSLSNNNNLWPTGDQDYRRHMQPGDIVESVDMEMSDDETDSKPKARVLVDLRSQDRDMRIGPPSSSSHLDMDMHFHPNQPNFPQNRPPPNFLPSNQQDFHPNQQEFHQLQQPQDFHQSQQDFEYHDREHNMRPKQDFLTESPGRGRYSQSADHSHPRDGASFHRNERSNRGGNRGFPRNRRDRYSDDHNMKQRNLANSRKPRSQISSIANRRRRASHDTPSAHSERNQQSQQQKQQSHSHGPAHADHDRRAPSSAESDDQPSSTPTNQVTVIPVTADSVSGEQQQNQYVPISEYEEHVESTEHSTGGLAEKPSALDSESAADGPRGRESREEAGPFANGPQMPGVDSTQVGPNGPSYVTEMHPATPPIYEYDGPNFRRASARPSHLAGRASSPRGQRRVQGRTVAAARPWMDRGRRADPWPAVSRREG
ncbi:hypothetical protein DMN91_012673 [Ooceraea biroi]|uniref:Uncharacterized protein n=1 Tax=Ooceraea biroi TaxID=2015173 RepID=A0A3L8D3H0_OOCBI|nr:hypothetical protein DMN91_012673 [Ooceraea biroi]